MHFFVACGLLIAGLALYVDARPASADVAQKFDPNAFGKSTFKSRKLISDKRPDKMESQDDAIAAILFDKNLTPQQKLDKLHKLPGAEDDTTETNEKELALLKKMDDFFKWYKADIYDKASPKVKEALEKMEAIFKKPSQLKDVPEGEVKRRMEAIAAPLNEMERFEFGVSILKAVSKLEKLGIMADLEDLADEMHFFVACGLLVAGLAFNADARPASADVAQKFDSNTFGKSTLKSRKLISDKRPDKMESQDDAIAAILFDKNLTPQQKLDKLHKLPGAEDDTTETNEKELALLKKMDDFFKWYKSDIYDKASPKVKEALGKMEDLFKKPSQMNNASEDEVEKRMDAIAAPLNDMEKFEFGISILKATSKLEKLGILNDIEDLADEST
ncbi:hypothetical protein WR25_23518 [Diploscapter pachys]|uniref:Domain of unknown function WSN domain-containing protein n=1 Tax=Diploscapter pachys TaxID=2018661 RepID=A0A2A2KUQ5_9BILA|nr:hypothetical protein WR25_23518 [Diploscapter pachys]